VKLPAVPDAMDDMLREMHHCARNNFQIISSLINLQRRMLPTDRKGELRFVEEHVQSMAAVYRVADVRGRFVPINPLVTEVVDNMRQIAGIPRELVTLRLLDHDETLSQDHAVALALLLAVVLPGCFDSRPTEPVQVEMIKRQERSVMLAVGVGYDMSAMEPLRQRLTTAYLRQLGATPDPGSKGIRVHFPLDR
jgi:Histidine kinase